MPHGDHTGPNGEGPKTGRGTGLCSGQKTPGYMSAQQPNTLVRKGKNDRRSVHGFGQSQGMGRNGRMGWNA